MPNLADQIREALAMFSWHGTEPAWIGGFAVVAHRVLRATKDVDFLIEAEAADKVHAALLLNRLELLDELLARHHNPNRNATERHRDGRGTGARSRPAFSTTAGP